MSAEHASALGFVQLTDAMEGADVWIAAGSIWAIEKSPNDTFTSVKTADSPVMVMEPPSVVFERLYALMAGLTPATDKELGL